MNTPMDGKPTFIAIHGLKRSGKGTIAGHLIAAHGYEYVKHADPLKDMARVVLTEAGLAPDIIERCIESDLKEAPIPALSGKSTRYFMQWIGTGWRDIIYEAMWSAIAIGRIRAIRAAGGRVVLDDLRFPFEAARLKPEDATLWRVTRNLPVGGSGAFAPDHTEVFADCRDVDFSGPVVEKMAAAMLSYCGFNAADLPRLLASGEINDRPVSVLNGATPSRVISTLRHDFRDMMMVPWTPSPVTTAAHISEQELDPGLFHQTLSNYGSVQELHAKVDSALQGFRQAA